MDQQRTKTTIRILGRALALPRSLFMRRFLGWALIAGGVLGFLPVFGFWMVPVGLVVLSRDSPRIRCWRRKLEVMLLRRWRASRFAKKKNED